MMSSRQPVTVVFGGQVGSEGKGAIVGFMARRHPYAVAMNNFMVNAGHTWVSEDGEEVMVQQLPISLINPDIGSLVIGPGAGIHVPTLLAEIQRYDETYGVAHRLYIDRRAVIIEERHAEQGAEHATKRGGVGKGCSRANAEKAMRLPTVKLARDVPELDEFMMNTAEFVNTAINFGSDVMVEGAQGFDLDLNHGHSYPHCTSRGTTPMQALADCGISGHFLGEVIATVRSYPIRVGNVTDEEGNQIGYSGDYGKELMWEEVARRAGIPNTDLTFFERTTVTKRVRRVFEIDYDRLRIMALICRPTQIALTFADYLDHAAMGVAGPIDDDRLIDWYPKIASAVRQIRAATNTPVTMIKTGRRDDYMLEVTPSDENMDRAMSVARRGAEKFRGALGRMQDDDERVIPLDSLGLRLPNDIG